VTGALRGLMRGATEGIRRALLEPEMPLTAVEVRPRSVGIVRAGRERGRPVIATAASLSLPEGTVSLSVAQPNLTRPDALRDALRSLAEKAGMAGGGRIGLVLPDTVARVALIPVGEIKARGRAEVEELVRFRLRKVVPFDTRESEVACLFPEATGTMAVAAAISRPVLAEYEDACRAAGLHPGLVELSGLALLGAQPAGPGDRLLVNWEEGYLTLILSRNGWPILVRTLIGESVASPEEVAREISNTAVYHRERLGGLARDSAAVRAGFLPPEEALAIVGGALEIQARLIEPPRGSNGEAGSHAVAGAVACVLREAA
jgi:hypothetical protein